MRGPMMILFLGLGLSFVLPLPGSADARAEAQRIAQLVHQLGSPKFAEREEATRQLDAIGPAALDDLRTASRSEDAEVRRRASDLVKKIEKRRATARLLAPQRLRLVYQDTPVEEAVADIARQTGFTIKLEDSRKSLAGRKVTLDTGTTTLWEGFDQFCARAGLVEVAPPLTAERNTTRSGVSGSVVMNGVMIGGNRPVFARDVLNPDGTDKPAVLTLTPGKPRELPTCYAGALRVRALPPGTDIPGQKRAPGEALLALDVTAEPSLRWEAVVGLRINRAIDDQAQSLPQLPTSFSKPAAAPARNTNGVIVINGVPLNSDPPASEMGLKQAPVRLKLGEKPAKSLKELSGTIAAQVRSAVEPLVTVDNILEAADQVVRGEKGGSVKVASVKRQDDGQVQLMFQVEVPDRKIDDGSAPPNPGMTVIINGKVMGQQDEEPLSAANFALLDAQGQPFKAVKATNTGRLTGAAQEFELTYRPEPGQGKPSRLVYSGRRTAIIEVPFRLKDVPLP